MGIVVYDHLEGARLETTALQQQTPFYPPPPPRNNNSPTGTDSTSLSPLAVPPAFSYGQTDQSDLLKCAQSEAIHPNQFFPALSALEDS